MRSILFVVGSLALLAVCACAPASEDVIQHIPQKVAATPSATGKDVSESGAAEGNAGASEPERARRSIEGLESDLLPSKDDVDASPFGGISQLDGRGRIRVLPAFLG